MTVKAKPTKPKSLDTQRQREFAIIVAGRKVSREVVRYREECEAVDAAIESRDAAFNAMNQAFDALTAAVSKAGAELTVLPKSSDQPAPPAKA